MWILIRWLRPKPADLDLKCFFKNKKIPNSAGSGLRYFNKFALIPMMVRPELRSSSFVLRYGRLRDSRLNFYLNALTTNNKLEFFEKRRLNFKVSSRERNERSLKVTQVRLLLFTFQIICITNTYVFIFYLPLITKL